MLWPWYVVIASAAGIVAAFVFMLFFDWAEGLFVAALVAGGVAIFFFGICGLFTSIGRHYDRVNCASFGRQSSRETRFVIYSTFSTDCLTRLANGKWISVDALRGVGADGR